MALGKMAPVALFFLLIIIVVGLYYLKKNNKDSEKVKIYDSMLGQLITTTKKDAADSGDQPVLSKPGDISIETDEEVKDRISKKFDDLEGQGGLDLIGMNKISLVEAINAEIKQECTFPKHVTLGCGTKYMEDPDSEFGCCMLKPGEDAEFSVVDMAKQTALELGASIVVGAILEKGINKALGVKPAKPAASKAAKKAAKKVVAEATEGAGKEAGERAAKKAASEGLDAAGQKAAREAAETGITKTANKAVQKVATEAAEEAAEKVFKEVGDKAVKEVAESGGNKAAQALARKAAEEGAEETAQKAANQAAKKVASEAAEEIAGEAVEAVSQKAAAEVGEAVMETGAREATEKVTRAVTEEAGATAIEAGAKKAATDAAVDAAGKKVAVEVAEDVSQKATAKALKPGATKAVKAAAQKATVNLAKKKIASDAAQVASKKLSGKAATALTKKLGAKAATAFAQKALIKTAAKTAAKAAARKAVIKAGTAAAAKMAALGMKYTAMACAGPPGWAAAAVMLCFDVLTIALDIIDVDGYETYTSQSALDSMQRKIVADGYRAAVDSPDSDWPLLFPLTEINEDLYAAASSLMTSKMFQEYVIPNIEFDPVAGPAWAGFLNECVAVEQLEAVRNADPVDEALVAELEAVVFQIPVGEDGSPEPKFPDAIPDFGTATQRAFHVERDEILFAYFQKLLKQAHYGITVEEATIRLTGVEETEAMMNAMQLEVDTALATGISTEADIAALELSLEEVTDEDAYMEIYDLIAGATTEAAFAELEAALAAATAAYTAAKELMDVNDIEAPPPDLRVTGAVGDRDMSKDIMLVPSMSTALRIGITLTKDGASRWNTESTPKWIANNDLFKPPETPITYTDPMAAVYSDTYYEIDPSNPGDAANPNMIPKKLEEKIVMGIPYGPCVAYCLKSRQNSGLARPVDPQSLGVTFDINNARCNFTEGFCDRYGLLYHNNDCKTYPGMGVAEAIFGKTISRGTVRTYKSFVVDNINSGNPARVAVGVMYAVSPQLMAAVAIGTEIVGEILDTKAKESRPAKKRSCADYNTRFRDDGTSCWLDTITKKSAITSKKPCSDWEKKHGKLRDDGTSCWSDTLAIKSSITIKKPCSDWEIKHGRGLRDDGTSCWRDTLTKKTSIPDKKSCDNWSHKYGKGLRDDGTSCWRDTIVKKSSIALKKSCSAWEGSGSGKYHKLRDDGTSCWADTYAKKSSIAKKYSCDGPDGAWKDQNYRDDGLSCWKDTYAKKSAPAKKYSCKSPELGVGGNAPYGGNLRDDGTSCWLDPKGRGAGVLPGCDSETEDKKGALCYPKCRDGYKSSALECEGTCPSGSRSSGFTCIQGIDSYVPGNKSDKPWEEGFYQRASCKSGYKYRGTTCNQECKPGFDFRSGALGTAFCDKPRGRYSRVGKEKPLHKCPTDKPSKDTGLCYKECGKDYNGAGPMCHPKSGAGIKKTLFDRYYCGPNSDGNGIRDNIAGVCWDRCKAGDTDIGALCEPKGGPGIKKTLMQRQYCGPSSTREGKTRKNVAGVCWDKCREGDKDIGALCEPSSGIGIKKTLMDRQYCGPNANGDGDRKLVAGVCWDRCPTLSQSGTAYDDLGALCSPKGGPGIKVPVWDRNICGPSSYQSSKCKTVAEGNVDATVTLLNASTAIDETTAFRSGVGKSTLVSNLKSQGFTAEIKLDVEQALNCPERRKNVAGVCWDKCPRYDPNDPSVGNNVKYTDIGALCHPEGGPKIKVPVMDREICGPKAHQPTKCSDISNGNVDATVTHLKSANNVTLASKLKAQGFTDIIKKEVESALGCPERRNKVLGVCWDDCPDGYKQIGALCEPPGGPGIRVPVMDREFCGPSAYQPSKCKDISDKKIGPTVKRLNTAGKTDLSARLTSDGFTDTVTNEVKAALDCPERRKKVLGVCWDKCPRSSIPENKEVFREAKRVYDLNKPAYDKAKFEYERWKAIIAGDGASKPEPPPDIKRQARGPPISQPGENADEKAARLEYNVLAAEYSDMKRAILVATIVTTCDEYNDCDDSEAAQWIPELMIDGLEGEGTAISQRRDELGAVFDVQREKFDPMHSTFESEKFEYKRKINYGYTDIGALCEPKGGKDDILGDVILPGPRIHVPAWEREYCDPGQKNILGICWSDCPPGYRDDGATCNSNAGSKNANAFRGVMAGGGGEVAEERYDEAVDVVGIQA